MMSRRGPRLGPGAWLVWGLAAAAAQFPGTSSAIEAKPAGASAPPVAVTLHARLAYRVDSDAPEASFQKASEVYLELVQPAWRQGAGASARYVVDETRGPLVRGNVYASGRGRVVDAETRIDEVYDKSAHWPRFAANPTATLALEPPPPACAGAGLAARVAIDTGLEGFASQTVMHSGVVLKLPVVVTAAPPHCEQGAGGYDRLRLELGLAPADEAGCPPDPGAAGPESNALALATRGRFLGATTEYRPDGQFVLRASNRSASQRRTSDLAEAQQTWNLEFVMWSCDAGAEWTPTDLPALDKPRLPGR